MSEESKTLVRDLTKGNVVKLLFIFALPLFFSNALQAIYNIVDMVVVGQVLGGKGMAAVSVGGDMLHLLTFIAMGFSNAGQVIISQYVGAGKKDKVQRLIGTMFTFLTIASVSISILFFIFRIPIMQLLNTPAESWDFTMDYVLTCIVGLVFIYGYNIVSAILRGMGDSKRPFLFIGIAAVLNTVLDILFVGVLDMKVFGAALATVIGQGVSFIVSIIYLYRRRESFGFDFKFRSFAIHKDTLKPLVELGIPMAIQSAAINISKIVLVAWINAEGYIYSALSGLYNKINLVAGLFSMSFLAAGSSMVGQNLGAKKYDRVPKILMTLLVVGLSIAALMALLLLTVPDTIFRMFTDDAEVLTKASIIILPSIINLLGAATRTYAFGLINGSGNSKLNLMVAIIDGIISRVGFAALLGFALGLGSQGFWMGDALAGNVPFLIGFGFYLSGKWKVPKKTIA